MEQTLKDPRFLQVDLEPGSKPEQLGFPTSSSRGRDGCIQKKKGGYIGWIYRFWQNSVILKRHLLNFSKGGK